MEDVVCVAPRTKEFFAVVEPPQRLVVAGTEITGGRFPGSNTQDRAPCRAETG
jgi:hypothetical protein